MITPQPMLFVDDVPAGSQWFQSVLGLASAHGGPQFEMLADDGRMVLYLHQWEADEHPAIGDREDPSRGNGVLVWFSTDDFDGIMARVNEHQPVILDGPLDNPNSHSREIWLRGPEGYVVVVAGPSSI